MSIQILSRRSTVLHDRPNPLRIGAGELCVNLNPNDPGLYFADSTASPSTGLIKAGPTFVGSTQPNTPAAGFATLSRGESWLDTASTQVLKIHDGSTFQTVKAVASNFSGKPSNPVDGQLHYDSALAGLYMYDDATSAWIAI